MKKYGEILDIEEMRRMAKEYSRAVRRYDEASKANEEMPWWEKTEAVAVFERMEAAGYCKRIGNLWEWQKTKTSWSYMARLMADKMGMTTRKGSVPYKKIAEAFFDIWGNEVKQARKYNNGFYPSDAKTIEAFFA